jgi:Tfp pilus assembly protein FimT
MTRLSAVLRRMLAPASRARLFIVIAILLAAAFGALSWRGIRDERTRVAFARLTAAILFARREAALARLHNNAQVALGGQLHH